MITRQQAIDAAYESAKVRLGSVSSDEFQRFLAGAEVLPVEVDGKCAGAVVVVGPEIHACILPWACGRWMSRRWLALVSRVIAEHGKAVTRASTDAGEQFVKRLGFVQSNGMWVKYGR